MTVKHRNKVGTPLVYLQVRKLSIHSIAFDANDETKNSRVYPHTRTHNTLICALSRFLVKMYFIEANIERKACAKIEEKDSYRIINGNIYEWKSVVIFEYTIIE